MSGGVVYEGAVVRGAGGLGIEDVEDGEYGGSGTAGGLFADKKFWIAHRIPERTTLLQAVKNNGGQVIPIEKNADYLIADHARKDTPPNSYSYKFIEDSVQNGQLQNVDAYLIRNSKSDSKGSGSFQVPKGTRTPFSAEDDRLLTEYVINMDRQGRSISGNKIYEELAVKYPHHTFQSWRDRWVKRLSQLPRADMPQAEGTPAAGNSPAPGTPGNTSASQQLPSGPHATPMQSQASAAGSARATPRSTRAKFTAEEDKLLTDYVLECEQDGKKTSGNKIYQELAEHFPQHTWHSWRDRWVRTLSLKHKANDPKEEEGPEMTRAERRADQSRRAAKARVVSLSSVPSSSQQPARAFSPAAHDAQPSEAIDPSLEDIQPGVSAGEPVSASTKETDTGPREEQNLVDTVDAEGEEEELPEASKQQARRLSAPEALMLPDSDVLKKTSAGYEPNKEQFYRDLAGFVAQDTQAQGRGLWPTIQGRTFELWDLWQAVTAQRVGPLERDWQLISESLGYNWIELPTVPDEVRLTYETYLADFEEALVAFDAAVSAAGSQDTFMQDAAAFEAAAGSFHSSPPNQQKRSFDAALPEAETPRKRFRISRDSVIPSTPDATNGTSHLRNSVSAAVSPSDNRFPTLPRSSQSARNGRNNTQVFTEQEGAEFQYQVPELPSLKHSAKPAFEPETQDFHYDAQTQVEGGMEQSPSQQLLQESDARSSSPDRPQDSQDQPSAGHNTPTPRQPHKASLVMGMSLDQNEMNAATPKARFGKGPNPALSSGVNMPKRRTLPGSFSEKTTRRSFPTPSASSSRITYTQSTRAASAQARRRPSASRLSTQSIAASAIDPALMPPPPPPSQSAKFAEIVEYYGSLGYSNLVARKSLDATSWNRGLAGEIMELLSKGEALPTNWEGVWTGRDDESLILADTPVEPRDEKEAKKRRREYKRILAKHGEQQIVLRRKWLVAKGDL